MEKLKIFGNINAAISSLEIAEREVKMLWESEIVRLTSDDVEEAVKSFQKIQDTSLRILNVFDQFKRITNSNVQTERNMSSTELRS